MKVHEIEIAHADGTDVYTVSSLAFGPTMANPLLRGMLGFDKTRTNHVDLELAESDLPDEDRPQPEEPDADPDIAEVMTAVLCTTVLKLNGEPVVLTPGDVDEMDMAIVLALFNAIHEVLGLGGGGQKAATFRIVDGPQAAAG